MMQREQKSDPSGMGILDLPLCVSVAVEAVEAVEGDHTTYALVVQSQQSKFLDVRKNQRRTKLTLARNLHRIYQREARHTVALVFRRRNRSTSVLRSK